MQMTQALHWCRTSVPTRTATIFGDRQQDWSQFNDRVARLAGAFLGLGIEPGDRIGIFALNSDRYAEAYYAAFWAGAIIVPFNTRWAAPETKAALDDIKPRIMLVDAQFAGLAADFVAAGLDVIFMDDDAGDRSYEAMIAQHSPVEDRCGRGDDIAAIFFTGGTTGRNKGVMLSHTNLMASCLMQQACAPYVDETRTLHTPSLFHLAGGSMLFSVTMVGGTHIILPGFEAVATIRAVEEQRINTMVLVPTMIGMMCETLRTVPGDMSSVRRMTYGGSAIAPATLEVAMKCFPNAEFVQAYGQTELSPTLTILKHEDHLAGRLRSGGRPVPMADLRIVNADLNAVPTGEVGEVVARGPNVMRGYWGLPELTQKTIVDGWLRTGDAGYVDEDGYLYLVDRVKDMIVSGGENVYSAEVENALMRHADVVQCAVIGVPDDRWGERVHAILFVRSGSQATDADIIAHCKSQIAGYKCPKTVELRYESLPLSAAGKVLKNELRKPFWEDRARSIA